MENNGPLSWRRDNSGKAGFEKREKRRNIRKLQMALCDKDLQTVKDILNSEFDVDFQYSGQTSLQVAVCKGWPEACLMLLQKGANVNHSNVEGDSLLNMASERNFPEVVQILLNNGADVDSENESGNTPLHSCALKGFNDIAEILLSTGKCNTNLANKSGCTPLFCASQNGNETLVYQLLKAGADPDWCDCVHVTPLIAASGTGHVSVVKQLLSHGADPNRYDRQGQTAVFVAASEGQTEILQLLHEYNANLDLATVKGVTPLLKSITENETSAAKALIDLGCDVNLSDKMHQAPIHVAIQQVTSTFSADGNPEMRALVKSLLDTGGDVNKMDNDGWTPLYQAALSGDFDIFQLIMTSGACLDSRNKDGASPLHAAVLGGNVKIVKMLLDAGCAINVTDFKGMHPLLTAVTYSCNAEIIKLLLDGKSDLSIVVTATKNTALHEAVSRHQTAAADILIDYGSSLTSLNIDKQTALYLACQSGMTKAVSSMLAKGCPISGGPKSALPIHAAAQQGSGATIQVLADHGCDLNEMNAKGKTPVMTAIDQQNFSAVRSLLQCGCDLYYTHKLQGLQLCCLHHQNPHPHFDLELLFLAVTHNALDIIKMLLQCYSVIPRKTIRMLITLLSKTVELNTQFTQQQKKDLFVLFAQYTHRPLSLSDLCRRCVRGNLKSPLKNSVEKLPVGGSIKRYISMEGEFEEWTELEKEKPGGSHGFRNVFMHTTDWG